LLSGLAYLLILSAITLCLIIYRQNLIIKLVSLVAVIVLAVFITRYVSRINSSQLGLNKSANNIIQEKSTMGGTYIHFRTSQQKENGNYIFINIQIDELKREWNRVCPQDSFSFQAPGYNLERYEVLLRYLASKGLNKDSVGVAQLDQNDILQVQKGV